ncbi:unnamed protein product [Clonostachys rosea]|uniref:SnoaL-like domain-containing protein n=1 Tax=Bionectria ochroleuca TaxID=29856 RepID=A0ABY6UM30_BIOOC|nr:unnamed protein product [Clonostachys rosea]
MGSPKSLRQILLQTGLAWVANLNDPEGTFSIGRTTDAVHTILPASLDVTPRMNNTAMTEFLVSSLPGLHNYSTIEVGDMPTIIDEKQRRIIMHLTGSGQTERGPYRNEYLWVLTTSDDGKLIKESFEYIDSYLFTEYIS